MTCGNLGQLGNQLFQSAAAISLAIDNNARYIHLGTKYPSIFKKYISDLPSKPAYYFNKDTRNYLPIPFIENMKLRNYYTSYKYFDHNKKSIQLALQADPRLVAKLKNKYRRVLQEENKVGLHIRTYYPDQLMKNRSRSIYEYFPPPNLGYIEKAINLFPTDTLFVVCSDNVSWSKKLLKNIDRKFFFSKDSVINDFVLLTLCDHIIISNSTYSWWAAYLNTNKHKKVIVPVPFVYDPKRKIEDTYPPEWIQIERVEDGRVPIFGQKALFKGPFTDVAS